MSRYWDDEAVMERRLWRAVAIAETHEDWTVIEALQRAKE